MAHPLIPCHFQLLSFAAWQHACSSFSTCKKLLNPIHVPRNPQRCPSFLVFAKQPDLPTLQPRFPIFSKPSLPTVRRQFSDRPIPLHQTAPMFHHIHQILRVPQFFVFIHLSSNFPAPHEVFLQTCQSSPNLHPCETSLPPPSFMFFSWFICSMTHSGSAPLAGQPPFPFFHFILFQIYIYIYPDLKCPSSCSHPANEVSQLADYAFSYSVCQ